MAFNAEKAVQLIEKRRSEFGSKETQEHCPVACGISLEWGTCRVNHCVVKAEGKGQALSRGDALEQVDGQLCCAETVSFLLHNGNAGSRVRLVASRSGGQRFECEVVRQHGRVIGSLFSLEEAVTQSQEAAAAVTGVARGVVDRHLATVSTRLVKLGGSCSAQEAALSERALALSRHVQALEDDIASIGLGDVPQEGGAVDILKEKDALEARVKLLESQAASHAEIVDELAEVTHCSRCDYEETQGNAVSLCNAVTLKSEL